MPLTALRPSAHRTQRTASGVDNVRLSPPISGTMGHFASGHSHWSGPSPHFRFLFLLPAESDLPFLRAAVARPDPAVLCRAVRHRKRVRPPTEFTVLCVEISRLARRRAAGNDRHLRAVRCASARRRYPRHSWLIISARLSVLPSAYASVCCEPASAPSAMPAVRLSSAGADAHARYMRFRALNSVFRADCAASARCTAARPIEGVANVIPRKWKNLQVAHSRSVPRWHLSAACPASRCQRRAVCTARA